MSFASFARESFQEIVTFRPLAQLPGWLHVLNSRLWKQTTNAKNTSRVFVPMGLAELAGAISKRT